MRTRLEAFCALEVKQVSNEGNSSHAEGVSRVFIADANTNFGSPWEAVSYI